MAASAPSPQALLTSRDLLYDDADVPMTEGYSPLQLPFGHIYDDTTIRGEGGERLSANVCFVVSAEANEESDSTTNEAVRLILADIEEASRLSYADGFVLPQHLAMPVPSTPGVKSLTDVRNRQPALVAKRFTGTLRKALTTWAFPTPCDGLDPLESAYGTVIKLAIRLAEIVACMHSKGLIHGNLRLDWVMEDEREPLLCYYGCRHFVHMYDTPASAQRWRWFAPELLELLSRDAKCDLSAHCKAQTDVFSFGVLLWELFTGGATLPYESEVDAFGSSSAVMEEVRSGAVRPVLEALPPALASRGRSLLQKCWHPEAVRRLTMPQVLAELRAMAAALPASTPAPTAKSKTATPLLPGPVVALTLESVTDALLSEEYGLPDATTRTAGAEALRVAADTCMPGLPSEEELPISESISCLHSLDRSTPEAMNAVYAVSRRMVSGSLTDNEMASLPSDCMTPRAGFALLLAAAPTKSKLHAVSSAFNAVLVAATECSALATPVEASDLFPAMAHILYMCYASHQSIATNCLEGLLGLLQVNTGGVKAGVNEDTLLQALLPGQLPHLLSTSSVLLPLQSMLDLTQAVVRFSPVACDVFVRGGGLRALLSRLSPAETSTEALLSACATIQHALHSHSVRQAQFRDIGGLKVVLRWLLVLDARSAPLLPCAQVLLTACSVHASCRRQAGELGGPLLLKDLIAKRLDDTATLPVLCEALGELLRRDGDNQLQFRGAGGLPLLVQLLTLHAALAPVAAAVCFATTFSMDVHAESRSLLTEAGGIPALLGVMKACGESSAAVAEQAFMASRYCMFQCKAAQQRYGELLASAVWVPVMRAHVNNASVCEAACGALKQFALHTPGNPAQFNEYGGTVVYVDLLRAHLRNPLVLEQAGRVGWNMLYTEKKSSDLEVAFRTAGGVRLFLDALVLHAKHSDICEVIAAALHQVVNVSEKSRGEVEALHGVRTLVQVMKEQKGSPGGIEQLCRCAWDACVNNRANEMELFSSGAYPLLVDVIINVLPEEDEVVEAVLGCMAASAFTHDDCKKGFVAAGGLKACVAVTRRFAKQARPLIRALQAICTSTRSHPEFQKLAFEEGVIEPLFAALTAQIESASVTRQCGTALVSVLNHPAARTAAVACGGMEVLLASLKRHADAPPTASCMANCVWHVLAVTDAHRDKFVALDGPALFVDVMRRGQKEVDVCVAATGALAVGNCVAIQDALAKAGAGAVLEQVLGAIVGKDEDSVSRIVRSITTIIGEHGELLAQFSTTPTVALLSTLLTVPLKSGTVRSGLFGLLGHVLTACDEPARVSFGTCGGLATLLKELGSVTDSAGMATKGLTALRAALTSAPNRLIYSTGGGPDIVSAINSRLSSSQVREAVGAVLQVMMA